MAIASEVVKQLGDIRANRVFAGEESDVFVYACGR